MYVPPHRHSKSDSSKSQQLLNYERSLKDIRRVVNNMAEDRIEDTALLLMQANLILCGPSIVQELLRVNTASRVNCSTIAALIAVLHATFPEFSLLALRGLRTEFLSRIDNAPEAQVSSTACLIAELVNWRVVDTLFGLEIATSLLDSKDERLIRVSCSFLRICAKTLELEHIKAIDTIFGLLRNILAFKHLVTKETLHAVENVLDVRTRKRAITSVSSLLPKLNPEGFIPHELGLECDIGRERKELRPSFIEIDEEDYKAQIAEYESRIADLVEEDSADESTEEIDEECPTKEGIAVSISKDMESQLRKRIYLIQMSSATADEIIHKIIGLKLDNALVPVVARMVLDTCAKESSFNKLYAVEARKLSEVNHHYSIAFRTLFGYSFENCDCQERNNLRNVAEFFGFLLGSESIGWEAWDCVKLTESTTTAASRIFIKYALLSIVAYSGIDRLEYLLFNKNNVGISTDSIYLMHDESSMMFCYNFFVAIGLKNAIPESYEPR